MPDRPLQDTIRDQVAAMYMWPKTLEIPVIDDPRYLNLAFVVAFSCFILPVNLSRLWSVVECS